MKLVRYGPFGNEKPGVLDTLGRIRDISHICQDISKETLLPSNLTRLSQLDPEELPLIDAHTRLGPCVGQVPNFLCVGLNYVDHALETGKGLPSEPVLFTKLTSAISGPNDDIIIPRHSLKTDWEVELGVVIGTPGKYISEKDAMNHIAGFCLVNDVSERTFQMERCGQWVKGKSCDTFGPIGPWLVTSDEISDVQSLSIWLEVDGHRYQNSNTSEMIFNVAYLVAYLSQFFTLQTGWVIATGTPAGVGLGQKPFPIYLNPGQKIRLGIDGLGEQHHLTKKEE